MNCKIDAGLRKERETRCWTPSTKSRKRQADLDSHEKGDLKIDMRNQVASHVKSSQEVLDRHGGRRTAFSGFGIFLNNPQTRKRLRPFSDS